MSNDTEVTEMSDPGEQDPATVLSILLVGKLTIQNTILCTGS